MRLYKVILLFSLSVCCLNLFGIDRNVRRVNFSERRGLHFAKGTSYKVVDGYEWGEQEMNRMYFYGSAFAFREYRYAMPSKADVNIAAISMDIPCIAFRGEQQVFDFEVIDENRSGIRSRTFVTPGQQSDGAPVGEPLVTLLVMLGILVIVKMRNHD